MKKGLRESTPRGAFDCNALAKTYQHFTSRGARLWREQHAFQMHLASRSRARAAVVAEKDRSRARENLELQREESPLAEPRNDSLADRFCQLPRRQSRLQDGIINQLTSERAHTEARESHSSRCPRRGRQLELSDQGNIRPSTCATRHVLPAVSDALPDYATLSSMQQLVSAGGCTSLQGGGAGSASSKFLLA